jgi:hypothetical protein
LIPGINILMRKNMIATHEIENIRFVNDILIFNIDGKRHEVNLREVSEKLLNANEVERNLFKISPSGYGIHWPLIDEDLAIGGLVKS